MKNNILFVCAIVYIASAPMCNAGGSQTGTSIQHNPMAGMRDFFPLSVGSRWEYNIYSLDSNGRKVPGSDRKEYDSITGLEAVDDRTAYAMHSTIGDSVQPPEYFSFDQQGNLWSYVHTGRGKRDGYWRIFAAFSDTVAGELDTTYAFATVGDDHFADTVQQTYHGDGPMTVSAGDFWMRMYSYDVNASLVTRVISGNMELTGRLYFARGVGKIKETNFKTLSSQYLNTSGGTYKELVSYSVK